jgi:hypothetical protein
MAFLNNMTNLVNKIERKLELVGLQLPEEIGKDKWADVIMQDSIPTFSRYFPHKIEIILDETNRSLREPHTYIIDETLIPGNAGVLGFRDINWANLINNSTASSLQYGVYGAYDGYSMVDFEDFAMLQMQADTMSLYNAGIYPEFIEPNKIRLKGSINNDIGQALRSFPIEIFVQHPNLQTIAPTKMEMFERLAKDDVAIFLNGVLKYYDGINTIFGGEVDLKLDRIQEAMQDRDNVVDTLEAQYVSFGNKNQPMIIST